MKEKLSIRVNVADRYYPLKIEQEDEEKIRRAAKQINDRITQYKVRYTEKDVQDFLAMTSLQFVIRLIEMEEQQDFQPLLETIKKIDDELGIFIKNT